MVLYYNTNKPDTASLKVETGSDNTVAIPNNSVSQRVIPVEQTIRDENILDRLHQLFVREDFYSVLEDNFMNLSVDDKLLVMHKTAILRNKITNNYILIGIAILIIILLKLF